MGSTSNIVDGRNSAVIQVIGDLIKREAGDEVFYELMAELETGPNT